jgi:hypothetical protein
MMERMMKHLRTFATLGWYEETITFLFTFTAKTSEVLLAAGLVVSTANFLTDGAVMGHNDQLATAWAWAQAFAIDSGLGITFFSVFTCLKQRDWLKATLYGLLTLLLAVVAGTITNIDTFSHALHTSIASATAQVGLDLKVLTTLRAIAVVGFVMMSRLKQVSFKDLYASEPSGKTERGSAPSGPVTPAHQTEMEPKSGSQETSFLDGLAPLGGTSLSMTELAHLLQILVQQHGTTISEEQPALPSVAQAAETDTQSNEMRATQEPVVPGPEPHELAEETLEEREARIERAYLELKAEGKRISGRSLAARAHIHRSTCNQWLESYQQRTSTGVPEPKEDEQGGAEAPLT